jgi:MerR family transcriptional regulator, heat shock protein HspR
MSRAEASDEAFENPDLPEEQEERPSRRRRGERGSELARADITGDGMSIGLDKPIYTLSVASEILDTHPRTLMMYEHLGMIKPHRTTTNRRRYSQRDMMKLQAIQTLTRKHRVNLAGARFILPMLKVLQENGMAVPDGLKDLDVRNLDL